MATLLLVEDDPGSRALYRQKLEEAGYQVIAVETASRALSVLQQKEVDVMVLNGAASHVEDDLSILKKSLAQSPHLRVIIRGQGFPVTGRASGHPRGHKVSSSNLRHLKRRIEQALRQTETP